MVRAACDSVICHSAIFKQRSSAVRSTLTLILALLSLAGCTVNPVTGQSEFALIGDEAVIQQGVAAYAPLQQQGGGLYTVDPAVTEYVQGITMRLTEVSDAPLDYDIVVLNDSTPNAWALPGGKLAVNRGLLLALENEAELAAVIGHEIIHAAARHGGRRTNRNLVLQGLIMFADVASEESEFRDQLMGGAGTAAQAISQGYSRSDEMMADEYGMEYMRRAGYDPAAAVALQEKFVELSGDHRSNLLDRLFASHPPSRDRVRRNRETLARLGSGGEIGQTRYEKALEYLRAKQPAYKAFDRGTQLLAAGEYDAAFASARRAISLEPKEARFYGLMGEIHLARGQFRDAHLSFDSALKRDDAFYLYYLGRGHAYAGLGQQTNARNDFQRSGELLPNSDASSGLGRLALAAGDVAEAKSRFRQAVQLGGDNGEAAQAFLRLDIADAPGTYIQTVGSVSPSNRAVIGLISNRTDLAIADVVIEFRAFRDGRQITRQVRIPKLAAKGRVSIQSGWTFSEQSPIGNLNVRAVAASVD